MNRTYLIEATEDRVIPIRKLVQDVLMEMEKWPALHPTTPRRVRAMLNGLMRTVRPGVRYNAIAYAVMDLGDTSNMLRSYFRDDLADHLLDAQEIARNLLHDLDVLEDNDE